MNCGMQPGREKAEEFGVCPAATDTRLHGKHRGKNAGRACWQVAGSFCREQAKGVFALNIDNCMECDFFWLVVKEEGENFDPLL
jgi:hypothetical protein